MGITTANLSILKTGKAKAVRFSTLEMICEILECQPGDIMEFVKEFHVDYHVGWAARELALALMQGHTAIPQSFIITRDGRIVRRFIGFNPETTPPQLKQALEEALVEKS